MTLRNGDTLWNHHPDETYTGDIGVNNRPGDVWYLVVDAMDNQDIAWDILNSLNNGTSWHIHPAVIRYIEMFLVKFIENEFEIKGDLVSGYQLCPVTTNFTVSAVQDTASKLRSSTVIRSYSMKRNIQTSFEIAHPITKSFRVTQIFNNQRSWR